MRKTKFKGIVFPDIRPLNQRETKMNVRKGILPVEPEKKSVKVIVQMQLPLFGNPYKQMAESVETLLKDNDDFMPESLKPDYVKKYYGHESNL